MNRNILVTLLGSLGIIPFLIALVIVITRPDIGLQLFSLYSLAIVCFLTGTWWSSALIAQKAEESQRALVVALSNAILLIALMMTTPLVLAGWVNGLLGLAMLYIALVLGELKLEVFARQPGYYRTMRAMVSLVVMALHVTCWMLVSARL